MISKFVQDTLNDHWLRSIDLISLATQVERKDIIGRRPRLVACLPRSEN